MGAISRDGRNWMILRRDLIYIPTIPTLNIPTLTTNAEPPKEEKKKNSKYGTHNTHGNSQVTFHS